MSTKLVNGEIASKVRHIPLSYNHAESQTSALRLIFTLFPDWEASVGKVEFIHFTDGKTNTVCSLRQMTVTWSVAGSVAEVLLW